MQFRRSGQRDERRRRVLIEEVQGPDRASSSRPSSDSRDTAGARPAARYPAGTLTNSQPTLVSLIPTRHWTLLVFSGLVLSCIAGLQWLYGVVALDQAGVTLAVLPAADLAARSSMAAWLASSLLVATAALGVLIYYVRRHRVDDYRGRYRMWRGVSILLVLAAVDQVAGLQVSLQNLLFHLSGIPDYEHGQLIGAAVVAVLVTAFLVRLGIELSGSRLALFHLVLAAGCYAALWAPETGWLGVFGWPAAGRCVFQVMVLSALALVGHFFLCLATAFYARHVHREASGQLRARPRRRKAPRQAGDSQPVPSSDEETAAPSPRRKKRSGRQVLRRDPAHDTAPEAERPRPAAAESAGERPQRSAAAAARSDSGAPARPDEPEDEQERKLSKAERRRLRKLRRRERQQQG